MNRYIKKILSYGHQNNPVLRKQFEGFTERDWNNLKPTSEKGESLVHSFQAMMGGDLASICAKKGITYEGGNGEIGPATKDLFKVKRCQNPDYLAPDVLEKIGKGSIPAGCYSDYLNNHVTKIYFDFTGASQKVKDWWNEVWAIVQEAYRKIGLLIIETKKKSEANHVLLFESLGGSTIGLAIVGTDWKCGEQVWLKLDKNYFPSAIRVAQVLAHEFAHNLGVGHINGDPIQNPSVVNQDWNGSFFGTPLGNIFVAMFGGEEVIVIGQPVPPTDPQPPVGLQLIIGGEVYIHNASSLPFTVPAGQKSKPFILTPK